MGSNPTVSAPPLDSVPRSLRLTISSTSVTSLDDQLRQSSDGEEVIVSGPPGSGKSTGSAALASGCGRGACRAAITDDGLRIGLDSRSDVIR